MWSDGIGIQKKEQKAELMLAKSDIISNFERLLPRSHERLTLTNKFKHIINYG